jgi:purine-binding chemotaxis protein CheW
LNPGPLQRALQSAPERDSASQAKPEKEYFCFRTGDVHFGVPSENVREVIRLGLLTPLPRTPAFILGVCGFRGEVLPVLDLLRFLGKGEARLGPRSRVFVGIFEQFVAAAVSDQVLGLRRIALSEIMPPPIAGDASFEHLAGVVRPQKGNVVLNLLDFGKVLQSIRQRAVSR